MRSNLSRRSPDRPRYSCGRTLPLPTTNGVTTSRCAHTRPLDLTHHPRRPGDASTSSRLSARPPLRRPLKISRAPDRLARAAYVGARSSHLCHRRLSSKRPDCWRRSSSAFFPRHYAAFARVGRPRPVAVTPRPSCASSMSFVGAFAPGGAPERAQGIPVATINAACSSPGWRAPWPRWVQCSVCSSAAGPSAATRSDGPSSRQQSISTATNCRRRVPGSRLLPPSCCSKMGAADRAPAGPFLGTAGGLVRIYEIEVPGAGWRGKALPCSAGRAAAIFFSALSGVTAANMQRSIVSS